MSTFIQNDGRITTAATSDQDLIRRGDAKAMLAGLSNNTDRDYCIRAIASLPAVTDPQIATLQAERGVQPKMSESGFECLILEAVAEAIKAMRKFPQPNYVISKFAEEAGEVVKAAIHCAEGRETAENVRYEMKQTIAMIYRLWVEGDQVHGLKPVRALTLAELGETK
jgi:hypothetical protein